MINTKMHSNYSTIFPVIYDDMIEANNVPWAHFKEK